MKLREYQRTDLPEVLTCFYETVHSINSNAFTKEQLDAWAPAEPDAEEWQGRLSNSTTFVAEHKGHIVGFGNVTVLGLIDRLYVHRSVQKTGVGGALLMRLIAEAKSRGVLTVQTEANTTARAFFEKEGFRLVREHVKQRRGLDFTTYIMELDIPQDSSADE